MRVVSYIFVVGLLTLFTSSCGTMHTDCRNLIDDRDAYRLCAAQQGNQVSQYELGVAALEAKDYEVGIDWLKRAARQRSSELPLYVEPIGRERFTPNFSEAGPPMAGHRGAQRLLAQIYEQGTIVSQNLEAAERYRQMINQEL